MKGGIIIIKQTVRDALKSYLKEDKDRLNNNRLVVVWRANVKDSKCREILGNDIILGYSVYDNNLNRLYEDPGDDKDSYDLDEVCVKIEKSPYPDSYNVVVYVDRVLMTVEDFTKELNESKMEVN